MTAGRGIIHSEMPQQLEGRMRGFQLWINLPANEKMKPAGYRDIQAAEIPVVETSGGARVKVIAGELEADGRRTAGAIVGPTTDPLYLDVELPAGARFAVPVKAGYNAFAYVYEGAVSIGAGDAARKIDAGSAALLADGDRVDVAAGGEGARFLLLAAKPLGEPIVQYGPFVMNTREEIEEALRDYQNGVFAETATAERSS
jgi:redox-sensitive bicupin YhaK (pirin superfamily)